MADSAPERIVTSRNRRQIDMAGELPRVQVARHERVSSEVARALMDFIFSGKIRVGERLPSERQLAESYGIGRGVVREALKSLELLGLVDVRHGGGTYLRGPDSELLPRVIEWGLLIGDERTVDLVETRQHLEILTARLAAERRTEDDLVVMKSHLERMYDADTAEVFVDADVAFHLSIAAASKNTVVANMLTSISSLLKVWITRVVEDGQPSTYTRERNGSVYSAIGRQDEHVPVYDAIEARDADAAADAMAEHMKGATARLRKALETWEIGQEPDAG